MKTTRAAARLRLMRWLLLGLGLVLVGRVVFVQVHMHERYAARARDLWTDEISLAPIRGDIYDRFGNPLAVSVMRWRVGVLRQKVADPAETADIVAQVLGRDAAQVRRTIESGQGHKVLARNVVLTCEQKNRLEARTEITLEDMGARLYPHDGVGASLLGFYTSNLVDGKPRDVATGLELGLNDVLGGEPGRARLMKRAGNSEDLGQVVLERARHGKNVVLTLDAELQAMCEQRLQHSVEKFKAEGGSILVMDPRNGDILAAASYPLLESRDGDYSLPGLWQNRNFTGNFEPGSVFKIMTTASLLRNAAIDTGTVFDCSNTDAGIFNIRNDDDHEYGNIGLMKAFALSSNIYFARAVGNLQDREFFRDLVDFGFGQKTTLPYPGQGAGLLRDPSKWSARSRPTIAIGQEVMVTPLQLALAVSAAANGGMLYAPRLVREVRSREGEVLEQRPAVPLRRIFSEPLARVLRQAMAGVVTEGTARSAQADWIALGGKTGTAQKSCPGDVGYTRGAYVASFMGVVPVDDPRLVILTVLDQPRGYRSYYAAQSALPLFQDVVCDIRQSTDWLADVPGARTAPLTTDREEASVVVPDVLHLSASRAARTLNRAGLQVSGNESGGLVVEQVPAAGTRMPRGQTVALTVAAREQAGQEAVVVCPDFSGLSNRQAGSLAASLGLNLDMEGAGYAVAQKPAPGTPLGDMRVSLRMEGPWR